VSQKSVESEVLFPLAAVERCDESKSRKKCDKKASKSKTSCTFTTTSQKSNRVRSKTSDEALHLAMSRELLSEVFLGALKERSVRKFLKPNKFRLYYKVKFLCIYILHTVPCLDAEIKQQGRIEFASPNWIHE
jgi:hypothetical protein